MRHGVLAGLAGLAAICIAVPAQAAPGRLVIAGGAVASTNAQVHCAFVAGLGPADRVAVIPSASGEASAAAQSYVQTLAAHGVSPDRIDVVHLAVVDDPSTPALDEAGWAGNATAPAEIAKVERAAAIWFTGGDQVRTTAALLRPDGGPTPMLLALRARHSAGATIGGTSAGAAVMTETMIARGDSLAALSQPLIASDASQSTMDGGALMLAPGLGFLPLGLVDQHFDRKARLGRLARALAELAPAQRIGFGVDEDTALVVDLAQGVATAAGAGGVAVLDARGARSAMRADRFSAAGLRLSRLAPGDRLSLADLAITAAPGRTRIDPGGGYYSHAAQSGAGMALPSEGLADALGVDLLDNRVSARLERISFDAAGAGVRYVFEETPDSWAALGGGQYTINAVAFSITPVRVTVTEAP